MWGIWSSLLAPQVTPELPVSLIHMALGRRGILCCFASQKLGAPRGPVYTGTPSRGSAVGIRGAVPQTRAQTPPCFLLRHQPRQSLSWTFQSLPTVFSVIPKCLDFGGWKWKCSQAGRSFFPCHSFLEKKRTKNSGFA